MPESEVKPQEFFLKPGFVMAHHSEVLVRCVLGSCVAVTLYDKKRLYGGMNHFVLPSVDKNQKLTVLFGNVAIPALVRILEKMGSSRDDLEAQIFGGGCPPHKFGKKDRDLGQDNLESARTILERMKIPVTSEDIGGCKGRKLVYNTGTNEAVVIRSNFLRATDWYDYGQEVEF